MTSTRSLLRSVAALLPVCALVACKDTVSGTGARVTLVVSPSSLELEVGQAGTLIAVVEGSTNASIRWLSSDPSIASVDGAVFPINGVKITGRQEGTAVITARPDADTTITVSVQVKVSRPLTGLVLNAIIGQNGTPINPDSLRGQITLQLTATNTLAGDVVQARIDTTTPQQCTAQGTPAAPLQIECAIDTAAYDTASGRGRFTNGPHAVSVQITAQNGSVVTATTTPVTFTNRDIIFITRNGALSDSTWTRNDLSFRIQPKIYSNVPGPIGVQLENTSTRTPKLGFTQNFWINTLFPVVATVDTSASVEDEYALRATFVTSAGGMPILANQAKMMVSGRFDNVAPRITVIEQPISSAALSEPALILTDPHGSFPAGDTIPLTRVVGGTVQGPDACFATHLHGHGVMIWNATLTVLEGPFNDMRPSGCGHGIIINAPVVWIQARLIATIEDAALRLATIRMMRAIGACDMGPVVDDVEVPRGNGVGESPEPRFDYSSFTSDLTAEFLLRTSPSMAGSRICVRVEAADATQPEPNMSFRVFPITLTATGANIPP